MPSGHIKLTSPNRFYGYTESIGVCVAAVRCVSLCSLLLCVINAKLTMLSAGLTPPPPLNIKQVLYFTRWYSLQGRAIFVMPARASSCTEQFVAGFFSWRIGFRPVHAIPANTTSDETSARRKVTRLSPCILMGWQSKCGGICGRAISTRWWQVFFEMPSKEKVICRS